MSQQYIYILLNASLKGLLKIGRTNRSPEERAQELSASTNMPTPFLVAYEETVPDSAIAEKLIHDRLGSQGYRITDAREFFSVPLKDAIQIVAEVATQLRQSMPHVNDVESSADEPEVDLGEYYCQLGYAAYLGHGNVLQNYADAKQNFETAISFGYTKAYQVLALMYTEGKGVRQSADTAIKLLKEGGQKGDPHCYFDLWKIFSGKTNLLAENKANADTVLRWLINYETQDLKFIAVLSAVNEYLSEVLLDLTYESDSGKIDIRHYEGTLLHEALSTAVVMSNYELQLVRMAREQGHTFELLCELFTREGGDLFDICLLVLEIENKTENGEHLLNPLLDGIELEDLEFLFSQGKNPKDTALKLFKYKVQ